ncbi:hypothetical protein MYAM1_002814 [Malassezia yamatoensis]|uniref:XPG-I domain-containing protein n=1 Tax=Malassezia yamatoensis TaxID=253288 RepID=A0AAJ5YUM6_9BASI|nr:hypothetical protein MYAM1_002814 [Malassezia yamatoensis]
MSLAHARIAIDATLLSQKLMYAETNPGSWHIEGMMHLIQRLRNAGAYPILVFDHPNARLPQKVFAHEKRAEQRALNVLRHRIETDRCPRTLALYQAVQEYHQMDHKNRSIISARFRTRVEQTDGSELSNEQKLSDDHADAAILHCQRLTDTLLNLFTEFIQELFTTLLHAPLRESSAQRKLYVMERCIFEAIANASLDSMCPVQLDFPEPLLCETVSDVAGSLHQQSTRILQSYTRNVRVATEEMYAECFQLCLLLDVPVFVVGDRQWSGGDQIYEAEAFASALVAENYADFVASEDSDVLLYHVPLLRGLGGRNDAYELVDSRQVTRTLFPEPDLDEVMAEDSRRAKLLQFALLCGTDFNQTIPGVGPVGAYKYVQQYGSIDRILKETKLKPPLDSAAYIEQLENAASVFRSRPDIRPLAAHCHLQQFEPSPMDSRPIWAEFLNVRPSQFGSASRVDSMGLANFLQSRQIPSSAPSKDNPYQEASIAINTE